MSNTLVSEPHQQCSVAAVELLGTVFGNGLSTDKFRATRQSGIAVSNEKVEAVISAYREATHDEYTEQQNRIDEAYSSNRRKNALQTSWKQ